MNEKLFITRKRKKYKFAKFDEFDNCFHLDEWKRYSLFNTMALSRKVLLEIGAGTGLLSVEIARSNPMFYVVAVDIKSDRLYTGAKLAIELGLKNIAFVRSDISKLDEVMPENSVDDIWITFPDPHANEDQTRLTRSGDRKRLTASKFLGLYRQILKPNGTLHFKTDNQPLFDWSVRQLEKNGWQIIESTRDLHDSSLVDEYKIMTSYEEKFVHEGLPIFYLSATIDK